MKIAPLTRKTDGYAYGHRSSLTALSCSQSKRSTMRMKKLGNTGLLVSELCLGTMTFGN